MVHETAPQDNLPTNGASILSTDAITRAYIAARRRLEPVHHPRLAKALELVSDGKVIYYPHENSATVGSSTSDRAYDVIDGGETCECEDYARGNAPDGLCKHILAMALYRESIALTASCEPLDAYQPYPPCPSDYEPAPTYEPPLPGWRNAHPKFVHHVEWIDADNRKHGLTLRTDDREEMLATLRCVKAELAAATPPPPHAPGQEEEEPPPAEEVKPPMKPCPLHPSEMLKLRRGKSGGEWYSHPDGETWCRGGE